MASSYAGAPQSSSPPVVDRRVDGEIRDLVVKPGHWLRGTILQELAPHGLARDPGK
jgi:hypothetical protein